MFKKMLVPVDIQRSDQAVEILKVADQLSNQFGCAVHVMTVMPGYGMPIVASYFPEDAKAAVKKELESRLETLVNRHLSRKATFSVAEGKRAKEVLKAAKRRKSDLILIGRMSSGKVADTVLGSVGTKVAQRAACSVMVVAL